MDEQCTICQLLITSSTDKTVTRCNHVFHSSCLTPWIIKGNNICCMCRQPLCDLPVAEEQNNDIIILIMTILH